MTLPRSADLRWQQEVIERWLNTPGIPTDAREALVEMLRVVKEETEQLEMASSYFHDYVNRYAS